MKCVMCRDGITRQAKTTLTVERGDMTLVVKGIPAQVCESCGEAYVDEAAAAILIRAADDAERSGVRAAVRDYAAG